jgi:hypothetical protein
MVLGQYYLVKAKNVVLCTGYYVETLLYVIPKYRLSSLASILIYMSEQKYVLM